MANKPLVSVVMPVRNESRYIRTCLDSILAQDYGRKHMEILVVDGMSSDDTREIVNEYAHRYSNVRLLDNPGKIVPCAMNIGILNSRGEIIVRVDGHAELPPDYVRLCVETLERTGADNVGGTMRATGHGAVALAIATATSSPFGIGNSKFHYSRQEGWVDTVYLGAFRRSIFERAGLYDETLVRNQDYELNYRIRRAGGRIFYTPRLWVRYHSRPTLRSLMRQYFQYGVWKARVIAQHPRSAQARHFAAPLFVASLLLLALLAPIHTGAAVLLAAEIGLYVAANLFFSILGARHKGVTVLLMLPAVYPVLHLSWGIGFLIGVTRLILGRSRIRQTAAGA